MANLLSPTSELEAVNRMLASIGQAPVNTLSVTGIGDVASARSELNEVLRDVLTVGWSFNTDEDYELSPDNDGYIKLPLGALDVDPSDSTVNVVIRRIPDGDLALYDVDNQTFIFEESVECRVIWGFPFDDLPQPARTYIATAAARRFQAHRLASTVLDTFNQEDQDLAWNLLLRRERATRDTNLFRANSSIRRFFSRRRF